MADVVPLELVGDNYKAAWGAVRTVRHRDLHDLGFHFAAATIGNVFRRLEGEGVSCFSEAARTLSIVRSSVEHGAPAQPTGDAAVCIDHVRQLTPVTLEDQLAETERAGERHKGSVRGDRIGVKFVQDLPLPFQIDCRGRVCVDCRRHFAVTEGDMRREIPGLLVCRAGRGGTLLMTRRWFLFMIQEFYTSLCTRAVRRSLVACYRAGALAFCSGPRALFLPTVAPRCRAIRVMLLEALEKHLQLLTARVRALGYVYNGAVCRGDGNYELASRIGVRRRGSSYVERPYSVVYGWSGTDGSPMKSVVAMKTEDWRDIEADLDPMVDEHMHARIAAGVPPNCVRVVAHPTDSYGKHRLKIRAFYRKKYKALHVHVESATPKADARALRAQGDAVDETVPTGEPYHDVIAFRKLVSSLDTDYNDILKDHEYPILRLSAARAPTRPEAQVVPRPESEPLTEVARRLLRRSVEDDTPTLQAALQESPSAAEEVREWFKQPGVLRDRSWRELFRARPPLATALRLARRVGTKLRNDDGMHAYRSRKEFRTEIKRMRKWYKRSRKLTRRKRGIVRDAAAPLRVFGRRSAWNEKVEAHYRRLLKPLRFAGLWEWRRVALALHRAGIKVHSGTIPVERMWSVLEEMMPPMARTVSPRWFRLLSDLAFLRVMYSHYNAALAPPWADGDLRLAESIDNLATAMRAMSEPAVVVDLLDPFS